MIRVMNTRLMIPIAILMIMFLVSGCGEGGSPYKDINYYQGSDGITMEFLDNSPPEKVISGYSFPVGVNVHNKGVFNLNESYFSQFTLSYDTLYLKEEDLSLTNFGPARKRFSINGSTRNWPGGQNVLLTLAMLDPLSLAPRKGVDTTLMVSLCYPYKTLLTTPVCIDADPYKLDTREQICYADDLDFTDQGAPVAITKIEYESLPVGSGTVNTYGSTPMKDENGSFVGIADEPSAEVQSYVRPVFRITIENVGDGQVVWGRDFGEQKLCQQEKDNSRYDSGTVVVRGILGSKEMNCIPKAPRFIDGEAEVTCMVKPEDVILVKTNYQDILRVELAYVYRTRKNVDIEILDTQDHFAGGGGVDIGTPKLPDDATCMSFDRDMQSCVLYADQLNCVWCDKTQKCLLISNDKVCEESCEEAKLIYNNRCVEPCPDFPPTFTISKSANSQNRVTLTCSDKAVGGKMFESARCGCDERYLYSAFVMEDNKTKCFSMSKLPAEDAKREYGRVTANVEIPDDAKGVCGYAEDKQGRKSNDYYLRLA